MTAVTAALWRDEPPAPESTFALGQRGDYWTAICLLCDECPWFSPLSTREQVSTWAQEHASSEHDVAVRW